MLCDSDLAVINHEKVGMVAKGIKVFDCENTNCLEQPVFDDLPWDAIKELLIYVLKTHYNGNAISLEESVKSKYSSGEVFPSD